MALQLMRGHVKEISSRDKHGAVACQIGRCKVKVGGDLVSSIATGDEVLFACEQHNDVFHMLAVKNIDSGKVAQVDPTNTILFMAASAFVGLLGFILDLQAENSSILVRSIDASLAIIGLVGIVVTLRRLLVITRAGTSVRRAAV